MPGAKPHVVRAQVADTLSAVEGLDLTWCTELGYLGARIFFFSKSVE